mmetsp:Transcript_100083/g.180558  ORF Transcript_100083/g.180558 Transcript_100083/m.180558 type:complete len:92 (+) Transcript_100083:883-1158(+)
MASGRLLQSWFWMSLALLLLRVSPAVPTYNIPSMVRDVFTIPDADTTEWSSKSVNSSTSAVNTFLPRLIFQTLLQLGAASGKLEKQLESNV